MIKGKTGIVDRLDLNNMRAKMTYVDELRNCRFHVWVPFHQLRKPSTMWQDPCGHLFTSKTIDRSMIDEEMEKTEGTLSILQARRYVFINVVYYFGHVMSHCGGAAYILALLVPLSILSR